MQEIEQFRSFLLDIDFMYLEDLKPTEENIDGVLKDIASIFPDEKIPNISKEKALKEILSYIDESRQEYENDEDDSWKREQAMEAGMLHGIDAYNDVMGFAIEEDDCSSCGGYGCHWCL
tara:strand:- start:1118 stop:1474 length:357 start_codon:yes stop_codon:yes gene_type:complete